MTRPTLACAALMLLVTACADPDHPQSATSDPVEFENPAGAGSRGVHLAPDNDGGLVMSWLEPLPGDAYALRYARWSGADWSPASEVARGSDWLINWLDFPSVVPIDDMLWAAHWLIDRDARLEAYDIAVALSTDGGASWRPPVTPHDDQTLTQHGFVELFPWRHGPTGQSAVGMVWLDGRDLEIDPAQDDAFYGVGLRSAVITPGADVIDERLIDRLVCDCCRTAAAVTPAGPIIAYRDRSPDEIRDSVVTRYRGGDWTVAEPLGADEHWEIAACPLNGPALAANDDVVAAAWFTGTGNSPRVRFSRSVDGGATFGAPLDIADGANLGRVGVAVLDRRRAVVSWVCADAPVQFAICLRVVSTDDTPGPVRRLLATAAIDIASVPQMVYAGNVLVVAWVEEVAAVSRVRTLSVPPEWLN